MLSRKNIFSLILTFSLRIEINSPGIRSQTLVENWQTHLRNIRLDFSHESMHIASMFTLLIRLNHKLQESNLIKLTHFIFINCLYSFLIFQVNKVVGSIIWRFSWHIKRQDYKFDEIIGEKFQDLFLPIISTSDIKY